MRRRGGWPVASVSQLGDTRTACVQATAVVVVDAVAVGSPVAPRGPHAHRLAGTSTLASVRAGSLPHRSATSAQCGCTLARMAWQRGACPMVMRLRARDACRQQEGHRACARPLQRLQLLLLQPAAAAAWVAWRMGGGVDIGRGARPPLDGCPYRKPGQLMMAAAAPPAAVSAQWARCAAPRAGCIAAYRAGDCQCPPPAMLAGQRAPGMPRVGRVPWLQAAGPVPCTSRDIKTRPGQAGRVTGSALGCGHHTDDCRMITPLRQREGGDERHRLQRGAETATKSTAGRAY